MSAPQVTLAECLASAEAQLAATPMNDRYGRTYLRNLVADLRKRVAEAAS